jgi:hypothetical protein
MSRVHHDRIPSGDIVTNSSPDVWVSSSHDDVHPMRACEHFTILDQNQLQQVARSWSPPRFVTRTVVLGFCGLEPRGMGAAL